MIAVYPLISLVVLFSNSIIISNNTIISNNNIVVSQLLMIHFIFLLIATAVTNVLPCVDRVWATLLVVVVTTCLTWQSAEAFSFSRLFPASRRGVRGTLLSTLTSHKPSSSALKNAVKQAAFMKQQQQGQKQNIIKQQQEAVKQALSKQQQKHQTTVALDSVRVATTTTTTTTPKVSEVI